MAIYDIESPSIASASLYIDLAKRRSEREKDIVARAVLFDQRTYELLEPVYEPKAGDAYDPAKPGPFICVVEIEMKRAEFEENLNRWYEEEHMALVAKIPSWVRTRRCVPINSAAEGSESKGEKPARFLAPRELEDPAEFEQDDFQAMTWTEWMKSVVQRDSAGVPGASVKVGEDKLGG